MKEENSFPSIKSPSTLGELDSTQLGEDAVESRWHNVIKRRSFLKNISLAGATVTASGLIGTQLSAQTKGSSRRLSQDDAALLRFAAAAELIEADLWQQYNEFGG